MRFTDNIKRLCSSTLLLVFLFGVVPPEYIHDALTSHTDDVDPILKKGEVVISAKHTHCAFLTFECSAFIIPEPTHLVFECITYPAAIQAISATSRTLDYETHFTSRGPPGC